MPMAEQRPFSKWHPVWIAVVVTVVCTGILTLLIYDRWSRPEVKPPELARSTTTGQAANSAGAKVLPTNPKLRVEPTPPAPRPVQPANPN
jgi:hypothetical protein